MIIAHVIKIKKASKLKPLNYYKPSAPFNLSGKAYLEIAKRILGEDIEVTIPGREKGFWAKIKRIFGKK